jgi:hypothetical protein
MCGMKGQWILAGVLALVLLLALALGLGQAQEPVPQESISVQAALGTAFTYQGQLKVEDGLVNDTCEMAFRLYDQDTGGNQAGTAITTTVPITDGLFTVSLDFGSNVFTGDGRWLAIAVQCSGDGDFTSLSPRQALTPAPYALALPGLWTRQNGTSPNLIGGYSGNSVTAGVVGATIGGGGVSIAINEATANYATVGGGFGNIAGGSEATVGGGSVNRASGGTATVGGGGANIASGNGATVGGGAGNTASGHRATVGGGTTNTASSSHATIGGGQHISVIGTFGTVGGGVGNIAGYGASVGGGVSNTASLSATVVGGGMFNTASRAAATVGGGYNNVASGYAATVGGGHGNVVTYAYGTIGGGVTNTVSGRWATVPGGALNTAQGDYSFAAGRRARANHEGAFVWGSSTNADINSSDEDQFIVRANGGIWLGAVTTDFTPTIASNILISTSTGAYLSTGGFWTDVSDRNLKENFSPVDRREILARLAEMPVTAWNYKTQPGVRHIGPTAQDFNAAFGVGEDDRHIAPLDTNGVALAAIQGLGQLSQHLAARIDSLEAENAALRQQVDDLEVRVAALEAGAARPVQAGLVPGAGVLLVGLGLVWQAGRGGIKSPEGGER